MGQTIAQKIIAKHLVSGEMKAGKEIALKIDQTLMERHLNKKARRASHKNHLKGPKKRTEEDDERFAQSFERMVKAALEEEK